MTPGASVNARGVGVRLGGRSILEGVDFDAAPGALTAIVGPNGSGKTTLIRALAGLLDFSGRVEVGGVDVRRLAPAERAQRVAYLPQSSELNAMLSVRQVVALGRYAARPGHFGFGSRDDGAVASALARVNAEGLAQAVYPKLSGGQKRLVLLARALATGASTLLLDEPTASLDVRHALGLFELLASLAADGYTVIVVLHDLDDVQRYAGRVSLLDAGRVCFAGGAGERGFVQAAERIYGVSLVAADRLGFRLQTPGTGAAP
jgi:iron complex transport system ATP-binding protein